MWNFQYFQDSSFGDEREDGRELPANWSQKLPVPGDGVQIDPLNRKQMWRLLHKKFVRVGWVCLCLSMECLTFC